MTFEGKQVNNDIYGVATLNYQCAHCIKVCLRMILYISHFSLKVGEALKSIDIEFKGLIRITQCAAF